MNSTGPPVFACYHRNIVKTMSFYVPNVPNGTKIVNYFVRYSREFGIIVIVVITVIVITVIVITVIVITVIVITEFDCRLYYFILILLQ